MFVFRAYFLDGLGRSSGYSSPIVYPPNSYRHGIEKFHRLLDIPKRVGQIMLGEHLKWNNPIMDEFLSWSSSVLFVIVHAIGRHEKKQEPVFIAFGNSSELRTPNGERAAFYHVNDLHQAFKVSSQERSKRDEGKLHLRKFTHEYLSIGELRDPNRAIQHVTL
jgi:hypothetical protein